MGLDASVMCTCYAEGNIKTPPFSKDQLYIDEDGYLSLNLPWEGHEEKHIQFEKWRKNACLHANMCQSKVRLSNWGGYRLFQEAFAEAGWEHFPILHNELPNANGGQMSSANAQIALYELDYFIRDWQSREVACLFDSDTGELLRQQIMSYRGKFLYGGGTGIDIGFDIRGLFVESRTDPPKEIFRSMRFMQNISIKNRLLQKPLILATLIDLETGHICNLNEATIKGSPKPWPDGNIQDLNGNLNITYPKFLHVAKQHQNAKDFEYILDPLREVLQASVKTGNPVRWE